MSQPSALERSIWRPIDTLHDIKKAEEQKEPLRCHSQPSVDGGSRSNSVIRGIRELVDERCATASQSMSVPPSLPSPTEARYGPKTQKDKPLPRHPSDQFDLPIRTALSTEICHPSERCPRILRIMDWKPATYGHAEMFQVEFAEHTVPFGFIHYDGDKPFIRGKQNKQLWVTEISDSPWLGAEKMKRVALQVDWLSTLQLQGVSGAIIADARDQFSRPREANLPSDGRVPFIPEFGCDYSASFLDLVKQKVAEVDQSSLWLAFEHHPKVRPLVFHDNFSSRVDLNIPIKFRSCFIHQVGKSRIPPCRNCREKAGPFPECIVEAAFFNGACTNCAFRKINNKCDHHGKFSQSQARKSDQAPGKRNAGSAKTTQPATPATQASTGLSSYIEDDTRGASPSDATWTPITTPASTCVTMGVPTPQTVLPLTPASSSPCADAAAVSKKRKKVSRPSRAIGRNPKAMRGAQHSHVKIGSNSSTLFQDSASCGARQPVVVIPPLDTNGNTAREAIRVLSCEPSSSESEHESEPQEGLQEPRRRHPLRRRRSYPTPGGPIRARVYANDPDFKISEASIPQTRYILDHCPKDNREWFRGAWESWKTEHRRQHRSCGFSCEEEYLREIWPMRLEEIVKDCCPRKGKRDF